MSPQPRKPAKPTAPKLKAPKPKDVAALERALGRSEGAPPPPDVTIRLSAKPPSAAALKRLGVKDPRVAELSKHLAEHGDEIAQRLAGDRDLAELLATDPAAALERLGVPEKLRTGGEDVVRAEFLDRFHGVKLELGTALEPAKKPSPATIAAVQLIADTFAVAGADAARFATLKTDPLSVVTSVAAASPPQGMAVGSAAAASVVGEVSEQIAAVYGAPASFRPPVGTVVRLPRPFKGA